MTETGLSPEPKPEKGIELTHLEHGLALLVALSIAYSAGAAVDMAALHGLGVAGATTPVLGFALSGVRHAIVWSSALVLMCALDRRQKAFAIVAPAALALALAAHAAGALWDWGTSLALGAAGQRELASTGVSLAQVVMGELRNLVSLYAWSMNLGAAAGLLLAARRRGRLDEGVAFEGPSSLVGIVASSLLRTPLSYKVASVATFLLDFLLVAILLPVAERAVKRGFRALRIEDDELP